MAPIQHPDLGRLEHDVDVQAWAGTIRLPALATSYVAFAVDFGAVESLDDDEPPEADRPIPLHLEADGSAKPPTPGQLAAAVHLRANEKAVADAAVKALLQAFRCTMRQELDPEELDGLRRQARKHGLDSARGVKLLVHLTGVSVLRAERGGRALLSLDFGTCAWDEEHGVSVLLAGDQVLDVAGCGSHRNRGEALLRQVEEAAARLAELNAAKPL